MNLPCAVGALLAAPRFAPATRRRPGAVDLVGAALVRGLAREGLTREPG